MKHWSTQDLARQTMLAAAYAVLVYVFSFASFGLVQFRIAEVLMIFVFFDRKSVVGLTIGCFVSSLIYGADIFDIIFGSFATLLAGLAMSFLREKPYISLLFPAIFNGIIVGLLLTYVYIAGPLYITISTVFIGEFTVMYLLGLPLYIVLRKNKGFLEGVEEGTDCQ